MNASQLILSKELDQNELRSHITEIQSVQSASAGTFDSTTAQSYANTIQDLEANQAALLLSTQGLTDAQIAETLAVKEANVAKNYQAMKEAGLLKNKQSLTQAQAQELAMRTGITLSMNEQAASGLPRWIASMKVATTAVWLQVKAQVAMMAPSTL